ncbi:MAG TPA: GspH/FimT family pseudopilin [Burkholderiales bacterium]|nr:GspH/FimT family pseudopilin [Burkholderiales bacterium]
MGRDRAPARTRGFTLIEMLVVMLIMGLAVGLASVIVRPDSRAQLRVEAQRLAQLLDLAASESRLSGQTIAWTADGSGYRFWRMSADSEWTEVRDSDLLRARTLPRGMRISGLRIESMPARGAMRLVFGPYGPAPSFTIELSMGTARYAVAASPIGEITVLPGAGYSRGRLALR